MKPEGPADKVVWWKPAHRSVNSVLGPKLGRNVEKKARPAEEDPS